MKEDKLEKKYQDLMTREVTPRNINYILDGLDLISQNTNNEILRNKSLLSKENVILRISFTKPN